MQITLGRFAKEGIEARFGTDAEAGARAAMLRYADRLSSDEAPRPLPGFLGDSRSCDEGVALELDLGEEAQAALEREAERQMVPLERLASHAVLTYLAELDAVGAISGSSELD